MGGLLVIDIDCMVFLSPFLDIKRILSVDSFMVQVGCGIICLQNTFLYLYDLNSSNSRGEMHPLPLRFL